MWLWSGRATQNPWPVGQISGRALARPSPTVTLMPVWTRTENIFAFIMNHICTVIGNFCPKPFGLFCYWSVFFSWWQIKPGFYQHHLWPPFYIYFYRISTYQKFCTLFLIWDYQRVGYLTPASLITALKDVYDILGLLSSNDHHQDAMRLFAKMKKDRHCR